MGLLIHQKFVISASGTVLSKRLTSRFGVSKTLEFGLNLTSSLHISFINFQVLSTLGQVQIKFHLYLFGIHLRINWVVELRKVSQMTASLALRETGPRVQN